MADPPSQPPLLWHYTSFDGLHGIVTTGNLFASSLAYLNDTEEFQYTVKPFLSLLESDERMVLDDSVKGLVYEDVPGWVKSVFAKLRGQRIFAACFSQERDDLSQWRSYTPKPPGFAIGFQPDELETLASTIGFQKVTCQYPLGDELLKVIQSTYDTATYGIEAEKQALPKSPKGAEPEKFIEKWALKLVQAISALAPSIKHHKFRAEREVRLVANLIASSRVEKRFKDVVEYRLSGSLVVPYIRIPARPDVGPSPIKEILVGPCPHQEAVTDATYQMCIQHGIRAKILKSEVPYRNW